MVAQPAAILVLIAFMEQHLVSGTQSALAATLLEEVDDGLFAIDSQLLLEVMKKDLQREFILRVMHFDAWLIF